MNLSRKFFYVCGIVEVLGCNISNGHTLLIFKHMLSKLVNRGPDAFEARYDEGSSISLGHVRLSILELSKVGAQPVHLFSDRSKRGLALPLGEWLRNYLKDRESDLLANQNLIRQQILNIDIIAKVWSEHQSGSVDYSAKLWSILILQSWLAKRGL